MPDQDDEATQPLPKDDTVTGDEDERVQQDDEDDEDFDDPIEAFQKAFVEQQKEALRKEAIEEAKRELEASAAEERRKQMSAQQKEELNNSFVNSIKATRTALESVKLYNSDGEEVKLDEDTFQKVIKPWQDHNSTVQTTATQNVYSHLAEAVVNLLPQEKRDEFATKADKKSLQEYLKIAMEMMAPSTDWAKERTKDEDVKVKAAEARAFARGQSGKKLPPRSVTERSAVPATSAKPDLTTLAGAAKALANKQISEKEYVDIHKKLRP